MTFSDKIEARLFSEELPPFALTEDNLPALVAAIEAEGYRVLIDPETGDVKLARAAE